MDFIPLPPRDFSYLLSPSRSDQCGFYTECGIYSTRNRSTWVWAFVEIRPLEWLTVSRISINKFLVCPISRIIPIARRKRRGRKEEIKRKSILYIYLEGKCLIKSTTSFFSDNFKWLISFHSSPSNENGVFESFCLDQRIKFKVHAKLIDEVSRAKQYIFRGSCGGEGAGGPATIHLCHSSSRGSRNSACCGLKWRFSWQKLPSTPRSGREGKLVDRGKKMGGEKGGGVGHGLTLYLVANLHIPSGRPVKSTGRIDLSFLYIYTHTYIYIIFFYFLFFSFTFHNAPRGKSRRIANTSGQIGNERGSTHKAFYWSLRSRNSFSNLSMVRHRSRRERFFLWAVCCRRAVCRVGPPARKYLNGRNFKWFRRDENIQTSGVQIFNNNRANRA